MHCDLMTYTPCSSSALAHVVHSGTALQQCEQLCANMRVNCSVSYLYYVSFT
jgi:hypothetical protein